VTFHELHPAARGLVGPEATPAQLDEALRLERLGGGTPHLCTIPAEAYGFCATASPAGGVARCDQCERPVFIPPETCLYRLEAADLEATIDIAELRARRAMP
jgi:hypothetical protein